MRYSTSILIGALAVACGGSVENGGTGGGSGSGGASGGAPGGGSGGVSGGSGGSGGTIAGGSGGTIAGGSGGTIAGGSGGIGAAGAGGTQSSDCQMLAAIYQQVLQQAKYCNALLSVLQCTMAVADELDCPCPTFVNPANQDAVTQLEGLTKQWQVAGCVHPCPAIACPVPQGAGCVPNGAGGDADGCQDFWPD